MQIERVNFTTLKQEGAIAFGFGALVGILCSRVSTPARIALSLLGGGAAAGGSWVALRLAKIGHLQGIEIGKLQGELGEAQRTRDERQQGIDEIQQEYQGLKEANEGLQQRIVALEEDLARRPVNGGGAAALGSEPPAAAAPPPPPPKEPPAPVPRGESRMEAIIRRRKERRAEGGSSESVVSSEPPPQVQFRDLAGAAVAQLGRLRSRKRSDAPVADGQPSDSSKDTVVRRAPAARAPSELTWEVLLSRLKTCSVPNEGKSSGTHKVSKKVMEILTTGDLSNDFVCQAEILGEAKRLQTAKKPFGQIALKIEAAVTKFYIGKGLPPSQSMGGVNLGHSGKWNIRIGADE